MVTPRLIAHHISSGRMIMESTRDRFDHGQNPVKTLDGELLRSYECDPMTVDVEFLLAKATNTRPSRAGSKKGSEHALLNRGRSHPRTPSSSSPMLGESGRSRPGESQTPPSHPSACHGVRGEAGVAPGAHGRGRGTQHGSFRAEDNPHGYVFHTDLGPVRELVSLQRWCSNNLNQVASHVNTYGGIYPDEIKALQRDYTDLWERCSIC